MGDLLIIKLPSILDSISNSKEIFIICWIPSHIGVKGNERTGSAAKSDLNSTFDKFKIIYTDLKSEINRFIHTK